MYPYLNLAIVVALFTGLIVIGFTNYFSVPPFIQSLLREAMYMFGITFVILGFVFRLSFIPTGSMEPEALKVGDKVVIWKMAYGARTPETVIQVPFFEKWYYKGFRIPYFRLPGYASPEYFDVFIFNRPYEVDEHRDIAQPYVKRLIGKPGDTLKIVDGRVYIKQEDGSFQEQVLPDYVVINQRYIVTLKGFVSMRRQEQYLRDMGVFKPRLVGDSTYAISATQAQYNALKKKKEVTKIYQYIAPMPIEGYRVTFQKGISKEERKDYLESQGIYDYKGEGGSTYLIQATQKQFQSLKKAEEVKSIAVVKKEACYFLYEKEQHTTNFAECLGGSEDQLPAFTIPKKGMTMNVDKEMLQRYAHLIIWQEYEGSGIETKIDVDKERGTLTTNVNKGQKIIIIDTKNHTLTIDGKEQSAYTFQKGYYWGMGDNRPDSADSRSWGSIPYDLFIGKGTLVVASNKNEYFLKDLFTLELRWDRILKPVDKAMWGISAMHLRIFMLLLLLLFSLGYFINRRRKKKGGA